MAAAALVLAGCTADGEPDVAATAPAPPTEASVPAVTEPATEAPTDPMTQDGATAGATTPATDCEAAVAQIGGLEDLQSADARLRPVFDACGSVEEFSAAVQSQLEGFENVDVEPYVRSGCTLVRDLTGTALCNSL